MNCLRMRRASGNPRHTMAQIKSWTVPEGIVLQELCCKIGPQIPEHRQPQDRNIVADHVGAANRFPRSIHS